ncbi:resuscitation-promoting factor [Tessaracoccus sp. OS52]|uniref:resuscitation-promoting factor n=1 Tax=Tessaracoccus sp. OS52 TaxID=2886691 RepID=UPI00272D237A|nr:resuscitation-promoting factor [Tessaracoccus sp. OS52]
MAKKTWIPVAAGVAALSLVGTAGVATALHKNDVVLVVDGVASSLSVREDTVAEVLELEGLTVGEHDVVLPNPETEVTQDMEITVSYGRPLEVTVDGETREVWTTAQTVDEALGYLNLDAEDSKYSTSRSAAIGREGLSLEIATAKDVTLTVAGKPSQLTIAGTVADVLAEAGVEPDENDKLTPAADTVLEDGMQITFVDVETKSRTEMVAIPFQKNTVESSELLKGTEKVTTEGAAGAYRETWTDTIHDGVVVDSALAEKVISVQPVHQVTAVGTKEKPKPKPTPAPEQSSSSASSSSSSSSSSSGAGLNLAREAMWTRIAQCESTNRWDINTGNGYYGGLQFNLQTWRSVNGQDFAAYPHQATRAEQITVANRLYEIRGTQPWACA